MKESTKQLLQEAQDWCDDNDKSTEFMIEFMKDSAKASHECVMKFLWSQENKPCRHEWEMWDDDAGEESGIARCKKCYIFQYKPVSSGGDSE